MSWLDKTLATLAPHWAARRSAALVMQQAAGGMSALADAGQGTIGRDTPTRRTWGVVGRDARGDSLRTLAFDRAASRDLVRTSGIAAGAIRTNVDRVVGTGLALVAQPDRNVLGWTAEQTARWKAQVQAEFSLWADSPACDHESTQNFYELQALVLRGTLESGDIFSLLPQQPRTAMQPYGLRIQAIEADRVGNPRGDMDSATVCAGIELDAAGVPVRYHLLNQHPGAGYTGKVDLGGVWIDRAGPSGRLRMLHHWQKQRPGSVRGVPYLTPIVDNLKQLSRYTEAEIMAAVVSACLAVFVTSPAAEQSPIHGLDDKSQISEDEIAIEPGAVISLAPGEEVTVANPGRPNPNFEAFVAAVLKQCGMALGLPFEVLIKQYNSSYSASKAALLDAWIYLRGVRYWLAGSFCQPVYETWLTEAVSLGRVQAPGFFTDPLKRWAFTRAAWQGDSMGSINPKDEIEAYLRAVDGRIATREQAEWAVFGTDFNATFDQKVDEQTRMREAGIEPAAAPGAAAPATATTTAAAPAPKEKTP